MQRRLGRLRLVAVLAVVVISLTGFQARGGRGGNGSGDGSDGGGCSSSGSSSHSYKSDDDDDDDDDDYGSTGDSSSSSLEPTGTVTSCADAEGISEVEVDNTDGSGGSYEVEVTFYDTDGAVVDTGTESVYVSAGDTVTAEVTMDDPSLHADVATCEVTDISY